MKYSKILALSLAAFAMTACSDDDSSNTNPDVTVQFASNEFSALEAANVFYVPLEVRGETNGDIKVDVEVVGGTAVEDKDYIITGKDIIIPKGSNGVGVEVRPVWVRGIVNDPITFDLKITAASGAELGANSTIRVTIEDVDGSTYYRLTGTWHLVAPSLFEGEEADYDVNITAADPSSPMFGKMLYAWGYAGYDYVYIPIRVAFDAETDDIADFFVPFGQPMMDVNSASDLLSYNGQTMAFYTQGYDLQAGAATFSGKIEFELNDVQDPTEITQTSGYGLMLTGCPVDATTLEVTMERLGWFGGGNYNMVFTR